MATPVHACSRLPLLVFLAFVLVVVSSGPALSTTLTVRQDGTGQFTTINAAAAAAVAGDIIEVGPGVYPEKIDFSISVMLVSTHGAAATILDGETIRRILFFNAGLGSIVDGFTLRRGFHVSSGGALRVQLGATATARNCIFEDNYVEFDGGAIICRDPGSRLDVVDCTIKHNEAARFAGGALIVEHGTASFDRCTFEENTGPANGGIAANTGAVFFVTNCLFVGNIGSSSAIYATNCYPTIENNTFYGNVSQGIASLDVTSSSPTIRRNIFANDPYGAALYLGGNSNSVHVCNIYWQNGGGAVLGEAIGTGELVADPLFCGVVTGDFTISMQSPAAPAQSACGQLIGAFPATCDIAPPPAPRVEPVILSIADVPDDEGRQVRIRWERADYDAPGKPYVVTGYAVYRYQGDTAATPIISQGPRDEQNPQLDGWDYIATVPARGDAIYQYVAPTLCDKGRFRPICWSVFFVSALTPNPLTYFDSKPDSGWSEDNIPPRAPAAFAVGMTQQGAHLTWEPSTSIDVDYYRIYHAVGADPLPGEATLIQAVEALEWDDPDALPGSHYLVTAVDEGGNESDAVAPELVTGTDVNEPNRFKLRQNSPNPFNPSTSIEFDVPQGGGLVTLEIFDVAGRRVRTLLHEIRAAGTWRVQWDGVTDSGSHVASGIYFYRLRAPGFEQTLRMTLVE